MFSKTALRLYCTCGAAWVISVPDQHTEAVLVGQWERLHAGAGHGPTDAQGAARARKRGQERAA